MSRFIVSRSAEGDRFLLQSAAGRTLAISRTYATLDACKKGMRSLVSFAPNAPLVDITRDEHGANPKFEIFGEEGALCFLLRAPNGKAVISSSPYATRKALLRAVAMLREGVTAPEVYFDSPEGLIPLTVNFAAPPVARETVRKARPAKQPIARTEDVTDESDISAFDDGGAVDVSPVTDEPPVSFYTAPAKEEDTDIPAANDARAASLTSEKETSEPVPATPPASRPAYTLHRVPETKQPSEGEPAKSFVTIRSAPKKKKKSLFDRFFGR